MDYNSDIGIIVPYPGSTIPEGWHLCDGSPIKKGSISDTAYQALAAALGQNQEAASLTLPDFRDRFPVGAGSDAALGTAGGPDYHSHVVHLGSFNGTTGNSDDSWKNHQHGIVYTVYGFDDGGDVMAMADQGAGEGFYYDNRNNNNIQSGPASPDTHNHKISGTLPAINSHNNAGKMRPKFYGLNFIIKIRT